jgi:pyruvate formate lyase activating enzyme
MIAPGSRFYPQQDVLKQLEKRTKLIDGVVISGGEPTMQPDLITFIKQIRDIGLKVKLDTNGSNPSKLGYLVYNSLVDFVALDIKGPLKRYSTITKSDVNVQDIYTSVASIVKGNPSVDYELRTAVVPGIISMNDMEEIGNLVQDAKLYVLQQFRPEVTLDLNFTRVKPYSMEEMEHMAKAVSSKVKKVIIR